jgi:hypothetical protein
MKMFGLVLAAALVSLPAAAQQLDLGNGADWICSSVCRCGDNPREGAPTYATGNGQNFTFRNECGVGAPGVLVGPRMIRIDPWHTTATVSPDNRTIVFDNGTIWRKIGN